jgi:hypothetical protein
MERLTNWGSWVLDEMMFWGEVIGEVLGVNRTKYQDIIEKRQAEIDREHELEIKRKLYERLSP